MNPIIKQNIKLMTGAGRGHMPSLLMQESMGGNAGKLEANGKRYPCSATNFAFDQNTGEIKCFDNPQNWPMEYRGLPRGVFRIAIDFPGTAKYHIIEVHIEGHSTTEAKEIIDLTVAEYNQVYGFNL